MTTTAITNVTTAITTPITDVTIAITTVVRPPQQQQHR